MSTSDNNLFLIRSLLVDEVRRLQAILDAKDGEITSLSGIEPLEAKVEAGVGTTEALDWLDILCERIVSWTAGARMAKDKIAATLRILPSPAANTEGLLAQLVDALRSVEWSSAWIDKEEVVSMTREICPYCDYKKADGHQQGCKVGDALDAALRQSAKEGA